MDIFLFVLGYIIQFIAACLLFAKVSKQRSVYGLSIDTQICFVIANVSRCVWTLETRLIETNLAYCELLGSTILSFGIVYLCFRYNDATNIRPPKYLEAVSLAPIAMVLAFFFHPGDDWFTLQILVAFTMYIEALGMIPQLWIMRKIYFIEPLTSHYVGLLVIARLCRMIFWGVLFFKGEHFLQLFLADIVHSICSADYMYLWFRKLSNGGKLVYNI